MDINTTITQHFDIRKLKNTCNMPMCENKPVYEILIYEYKKGRKTEIAGIYVCKKHLDNAKQSVENVKKITTKSIIDFSVKEL